MEKTIDIIILLMLTTNMIMLIVFFIKLSGKNNFIEILEKIKKNDSNQKEIYKRLSEKSDNLRIEFSTREREQRKEISSSFESSFSTLSSVLVENLTHSVNTQNAHLTSMEERLKTFSLENEQKLSQIRDTVEKQLAQIQNDNNKKLDDMRTIVTEKLDQTINSRMTESFKLVNERLEQVYKGLGEMQSLAAGVGDLKKVLSNVKTRGILGEIQLGSILREILSPEQFGENVAVKPGSRNVVEFAVKLPSENGGFVYLPIDSKFPGDTYAAVRDAYENCDSALLANAMKRLKMTIRSEAKDIHDKYIAPPYTTDFAVMFLPFEGLYSEVVNMGMIEELQRDFKVNIAGPSTMAALLNSLQMGFRTLAIQKRSNEVWKLLEDVSSEFNTFEKALKSAQDKLRKADEELDKLVGVRTRQMQKKLLQVSKYEENN